MKVAVIVIFIWLLIGLAINTFTSNFGVPIEDEDEKKDDLLTDLIMGPLGPILFWIWVKNNKKDE